MLFYRDERYNDISSRLFHLKDFSSPPAIPRCSLSSLLSAYREFFDLRSKRSNFCRTAEFRLRDQKWEHRDVTSSEAFRWPREYRGREITIGLWWYSAIKSNIARIIIRMNACLFFWLQRSLRTRISTVANYLFKSGTRWKRMFNLAILNHGTRARQTDVQWTGTFLYVV